MFVSKMADADGEATETQVWLDFARDCRLTCLNKNRPSDFRNEKWKDAWRADEGSDAICTCLGVG
jgi:hypothetical protein